MKFTWASFRKVEASKTIGSFLEVNLPGLGIETLKAKVDTGAYSGALHATRIREVVDNSGVKRLRFCPIGSKDHTVEMDAYHKRRVKSSNGIASTRFAVDTEIEIFGKVYPITITLANRSAMKYHMIVGRNFLRVHGFLIDVSNKGN